MLWQEERGAEIRPKRFSQAGARAAKAGNTKQGADDDPAAPRADKASPAPNEAAANPVFVSELGTEE